MSEKLIRQQMETNVFGTMKVTRAVLPLMRTQGSGLVIVMSSASGIRAVGGSSIYSASKFALEGWTEGMSADLKPFGIRCMLVEPGPFRTDFANFDTSLAFSDLKIDEYGERREALYNSFASLNQTQPGDPGKARASADDRGERFQSTAAPPGRQGRLAAVDQYLNGRRAEYEAWREISASTDFD